MGKANVESRVCSNQYKVTPLSQIWELTSLISTFGKIVVLKFESQVKGSQYKVTLLAQIWELTLW